MYIPSGTRVYNTIFSVRGRSLSKCGTMKAVILLAILAVAAARPEAPLSPRYGPPSHSGHHSSGHRSNGHHSNGHHSNGHHSNGHHSNGHRNNGHNSNALAQGYQLATEAIFANQNGGAPAPQYGPPSAKYGPPGYQSATPITTATEDPLAEPASYKFEYKVEDEEAGLDFGHQEEREGDEAMGEYRVLLPDGRTMIVTYTANQDGYKPEIKFEEAKGGYSRGPQNGY